MVSGVMYCLFTSCAPVYEVGFINTGKQPVLIKAEITKHFQTNHNMILHVIPGSNAPMWVDMVVNPGDTVICGQTIAEMEDEMPFTQLKIYSVHDSIIVKNKEAILNLYDYTIIGSPYLLEVK